MTKSTVDTLLKKANTKKEKAKDSEVKEAENKAMKGAKNKSVIEDTDNISPMKDNSVTDKSKDDKPKSSIPGAAFMLAGDLLSGIGKMGGLNNEKYFSPLQPVAGAMYELGVQHAISNTASGLGKQTMDLIETIGAEDSTGWAKLQLLERLMQNRDAAFQRRLQYGIGR